MFVIICCLIMLCAQCMCVRLAHNGCFDSCAEPARHAKPLCFEIFCIWAKRASVD